VTSQEIPRGVQCVSEREPVRDESDVTKSAALEKRDEIGLVVPPKVPNPFVLRAKATTPLRHADENPSAWSDVLQPARQRRFIVLDVFEHLKGAQHVEQLRRRKILDSAVDDAPTVADSLFCGRKRRHVGFEPDVLEPVGEHGAHRSEACSDFEKTPSVRGQQSANDVVPQPTCE
jgi:hypothetical protein